MKRSMAQSLKIPMTPTTRKTTPMTMTTFTSRSRSFVLAAAAVLALSACGTTSADRATTEAVIEVEDAWVKASEGHMTSAFATLTNTSDEEVTVVAAASDAAARAELHEVVTTESGQMTMREKDGGIRIPGGESVTLEPGGDHIMLMDLGGPIVPGDEITVTLVLADDAELEFSAPAKDYTGANESYGRDEHEGADHDGTDHGHEEEHS